MYQYDLGVMEKFSVKIIKVIVEVQAVELIALAAHEYMMEVLRPCVIPNWMIDPSREKPLIINLLKNILNQTKL